MMSQQKKRFPLTAFGLILMGGSVLLAFSRIEGNGTVMAFLTAALPWILCGLGAACACAGMVADRKVKEALNKSEQSKVNQCFL